MARNHRTLDIFTESDQLVAQVYAYAATLPDYEKYGLASQLRRAAVSVPTNIVEGCGRRTDANTSHFVFIAAASAGEVCYLLQLAPRLHGESEVADSLVKAYTALLTPMYSYARYLLTVTGNPA